MPLLNYDVSPTEIEASDNNYRRVETINIRINPANHTVTLLQLEIDLSIGNTGNDLISNQSNYKVKISSSQSNSFAPPTSEANKIIISPNDSQKGFVFEPGDDTLIVELYDVVVNEHCGVTYIGYKETTKEGKKRTGELEITKNQAKFMFDTSSFLVSNKYKEPVEDVVDGDEVWLQWDAHMTSDVTLSLEYIIDGINTIKESLPKNPDGIIPAQSPTTPYTYCYPYGANTKGINLYCHAATFNLFIYSRDSSSVVTKKIVATKELPLKKAEIISVDAYNFAGETSAYIKVVTNTAAQKCKIYHKDLSICDNPPSAPYPNGKLFSFAFPYTDGNSYRVVALNCSGEEQYDRQINVVRYKLENKEIDLSNIIGIVLSQDGKYAYVNHYEEKQNETICQLSMIDMDTYAPSLISKNLVINQQPDPKNFMLVKFCVNTIALSINNNQRVACVAVPSVIKGINSKLCMVDLGTNKCLTFFESDDIPLLLKSYSKNNYLASIWRNNILMQDMGSEQNTISQLNINSGRWDPQKFLEDIITAMLKAIIEDVIEVIEELILILKTWKSKLKSFKLENNNFTLLRDLQIAGPVLDLIIDKNEKFAYILFIENLKLKISNVDLNNGSLSKTKHFSIVGKISNPLYAPFFYFRLLMRVGSKYSCYVGNLIYVLCPPLNCLMIVETDDIYGFKDIFSHIDFGSDIPVLLETSPSQDRIYVASFRIIDNNFSSVLRVIDVSDNSIKTVSPLIESDMILGMQISADGNYIYFNNKSEAGSSAFTYWNIADNAIHKIDFARNDSEFIYNLPPVPGNTDKLFLFDDNKLRIVSKNKITEPSPIIFSSRQPSTATVAFGNVMDVERVEEMQETCYSRFCSKLFCS